jgi:hypothetical protein
MIKEDRAAGIAEDNGGDYEVQCTVRWLPAFPSPHQRLKLLRYLRDTAI